MNFDDFNMSAIRAAERSANNWKNQMNLNHVFENSSMLSSASYDTEKQELTVMFTSGKTYTYVDVELEFYDSLIKAPSAGKFFNAHKTGLEQKK